MKIIKDIVYGTQDTQNQKFDIYLPENELTEPADVLIYFHGGGFEKGDKVCSLQFEQFINKGKVVISANYRMYPTAKYPEFLEDGAAVVAWAKENLSEYVKVGRIFVSGSSAGAYLTAMLAFDTNYLGKYGINTTDIAGYAIDSAQMTTHFNVLRERGIDKRRIVVDEAAPVYHITEKTEFPYMLVLVSEYDMPCRLEQNLIFLKTLEIFQCPQEKIQYKLMEGFKHCKYIGTKMYAELLIQFMNSVE